MRMKLLALALALTLTAAAQSGLRFDQLRDIIRSSINQGLSDKDVAKYLKNQSLTFALTDPLIEDFQGMGAGPRTLEALRVLRDQSQGLPAATAAVAQERPAGPPPPSKQEQERILAEARRNALEYTDHLPDFLCLQITRRFIDPSGLEMDWLQYDEVKSRVSYVEGHENYELVSVNNQVTERSIEDLGGATSTGEFGSLLKELFEPRTAAVFNWARHSLLRGRPVYVFAFDVPRSRSKWRLTYTAAKNAPGDQITTAYRGLVYIDKETERTLRIKMDAADVPSTFPIQEASTRLDYDYIDISSTPHLLPLKAEVRMRAGRELNRNDVEFRLYRKFSADASISFDEIDNLPELPAEEPPAQNP
ncbi:MAG: hypothetical protein H6509_15635 [Bryobacterales bacterium]|nr:hypothetical protein [Acidobacteriota bacterium]MCB9386042.1 hypothetical protein [Bryobacterales bacterium]